MMRKILFGAVLAALCSGSLVQARLGDSQETLDKKHGEGKVLPPEKGVQLKVYQNEGLTILVYFRNGHSAKEVYSEVNGSFISPQIFQALLKANSANKRWLPLDEKGEVSSGEEPARIKSDLGESSELLREDQQAVARLFFQGDKITTIVICEADLAEQK